MKKLILWLIVLYVLGQVGYDMLMRNKAKNMDKYMEQIASEMDAKTPFEGPNLTVTKVAYSERTLRLTAHITSEAWSLATQSESTSSQLKTEITNAVRAQYCATDTFRKYNVSNEYELFGPPRGFNDIKRDRWFVLKLRPEDC